VRPRSAAALALALALALASCAGQRSVPERGSGPRLFWSLETVSGGRLYLQGTMHMGKEELYPLHPESLAALARADVVMAELSREELDSAQTQTLKRMMESAMTDLSTLMGLVPADEYSWLQDTLGLDVLFAVDSFEPWVAQSLVDNRLALAAGLDPGKGIDLALYEEAERLGKAVEGLETVAFQLDVLTDHPRDRLVAMLRDSIREGRDHPETLSLLYEAYRDDDRAAFRRIIAESLERTLAFDPRLGDLSEALFEERNARWASLLADELADGKTLYLFVGAGHCVGEGNLIDKLAELGCVTLP